MGEHDKYFSCSKKEPRVKTGTSLFVEDSYGQSRNENTKVGYEISEEDSPVQYDQDTDFLVEDDGEKNKNAVSMMIDDLKSIVNWRFALPVLVISFIVYVYMMYEKTKIDNLNYQIKETPTNYDVSSTSKDFEQRVEAAKAGLYIPQNVPLNSKFAKELTPDQAEENIWIGIWRGDIEHVIRVKGEDKPRWSQRSEILLKIDESGIITGATDYGCKFYGRARFTKTKPNNLEFSGGMRSCTEKYQEFDSFGVMYVQMSGLGVKFRAGKKLIMDRRKSAVNVVEGSLSKEKNPAILQAIEDAVNKKKAAQENVE